MMDEISGKLDDAYHDQLASTQKLRRAIADLALARTHLEERLARLRQDSAEVAGERPATAAEIQQLIDEAESEIGTLTASEHESIRNSQSLQFQLDRYRSAKEVIKARMVSAELTAHIGNTSADLDRLIERLAAALTDFEAATAQA